MPPADAATNSYQLAVLQSVVCTAVGECSAVGEYTDTSHANKPMAVTATHGVWGRARNIRLPGSADIPHGGLPQAPSSLACSGRGDWRRSSTTTPMRQARRPLQTETAGIWRRANPDLRRPSGRRSRARSFTCTTPGDCVAVGTADNRRARRPDARRMGAPPGAWRRPQACTSRATKADWTPFSVACRARATASPSATYGAHRRGRRDGSQRDARPLAPRTARPATSPTDRARDSRRRFSSLLLAVA